LGRALFGFSTFTPSFVLFCKPANNPLLIEVSHQRPGIRDGQPPSSVPCLPGRVGCPSRTIYLVFRPPDSVSAARLLEGSFTGEVHPWGSAPDPGQGFTSTKADSRQNPARCDRHSRERNGGGSASASPAVSPVRRTLLALWFPQPPPSHHPRRSQPSTRIRDPGNRLPLSGYRSILEDFLTNGIAYRIPLYAFYPIPELFFEDHQDHRHHSHFPYVSRNRE